MAGRPRLSLYEYCAIDFRRCGICGGIFQSLPKIRRRYCNDECSVKAIMIRPSNTYSLSGAVEHLRQDRKAKTFKQVRQEVTPPPLPEVARNPVHNSHRPGAIAFALLYGGPTFSLHVPGDDRVGRGSGRSARQVGGPNV